LISGTLTALNFGQLPASLLLLLAAGKLERRAWPYVASGLLSLLSIAGLVLTVGQATIIWAALLGFSNAAALILALTLPSFLCRSEDVARTSAGMFTISYGGAVAIAIVSGAAWDVSGIPALTFVPLGACAIGLAAVTVSLYAKKELV
jgi:CP family cyanate transporter-like MFS transporter